MKTRNYKFYDEDAEEIQNKIDHYFFECDSIGVQVKKVSGGKLIEYNTTKPYTMEGLALALSVDVSTVWRYSRGTVNPENDKIRTIIQEAVLKVHARHVESGLLGVYEPTFAKFIAECGLGYGKKDDDEKGDTLGSNDRNEILEKNLKIGRDAIGKSGEGEDE